MPSCVHQKPAFNVHVEDNHNISTFFVYFLSHVAFKKFAFLYVPSVSDNTNKER